MLLLLLHSLDEDTHFTGSLRMLFFLYVQPELVPLGFNRETVKVHAPLS